MHTTSHRTDMDLLSNPQACPVCHDLKPGLAEHQRELRSSRTRNLDPIRFETSLSAVKQQMEFGCNFCTVLFRGFQHFWDSVYERDWTEIYRPETTVTVRLSPGTYGDVTLSKDENWITPQYQIMSLEGTDSSFELALRILKLVGTHHPWQIFKSIPLRLDDIMTEERRRVLLSWVRNCSDNHDVCRSPCSGTPRRLIEIKPLSTRRYALAVKDFVSTDERPHYLTLSHSWAVSRAKDSATLDSNITERMKSLPLVELSKTLQDAVKITAWLGFRYIWIDSICIIQNNDEDKQQELSVMGGIYAGSYITLAAQSHPGSTRDHGMFLRRDLFLEVKGQDAQHGSEFSTFVKPLFPHGPDNPRSLTGRAWCVQERLLSPRVLHFRKWEVMFECNQAYHCECEEMEFSKLPHEPEEPEKKLKQTLNGVLRPTRPLYNDDSPEPEDLEAKAWENWHDVVEEYSRASLSYPTDRLPALSGIASRMPQAWGPYIAGLWSKNLLWELLWDHPNFARGPRYRWGRTRKYVAPSFSWAATSGGIGWKFHPGPISRQAEVVEVSVTPKDCRNPFSEVREGAFIKIRCRRISATFKSRGPLDLEGHETGLQNGIQNFYCPLHWLTVISPPSDGFVLATADTVDVLSEFDVGSVIVAEIMITSGDYHEALLLSKCASGYKRVGRATFSSSDWDIFDGAQEGIITLL